MGYEIFSIETRVAPANAPAWDRARRELFLLRPDVAVPCSIDEIVWPGDDGPDARTMAFGIFVPSPDHEAGRFVRSLGVPLSAPDPAGTLLGYDVADSGFISGLSNCGYRSDVDDVAALRQRWAGKINHHGLLATHADALTFRDLSDGRIPEHAPFFVFGLWEL